MHQCCFAVTQKKLLTFFYAHKYDGSEWNSFFYHHCHSHFIWVYRWNSPRFSAPFIQTHECVLECLGPEFLLLAVLRWQKHKKMQTHKKQRDDNNNDDGYGMEEREGERENRQWRAKNARGTRNTRDYLIVICFEMFLWRDTHASNEQKQQWKSRKRKRRRKPTAFYEFEGERCIFFPSISSCE